MTDDLYRTPSEALERELANFKERLVSEKAEVVEFEALAREHDEGLSRLVEDAKSDVKRTEALIAEYRASIKALKGRRS